MCIKYVAGGGEQIASVQGREKGNGKGGRMSDTTPIHINDGVGL